MPRSLGITDKALPLEFLNENPAEFLTKQLLRKHQFRRMRSGQCPNAPMPQC